MNTKKLNILIIVPRMNIGGAESHAAMLAPLLKKQGNNVIVASGGGRLADKLKREGIPQVFLPVRLSTDLDAFLLKSIIKKYNIDIIHAHSAAAGIAAVKYKLGYQPSIPVVYTAHGLFGGNNKEKILFKCDKIIAVSRYVRDVAIENGCPADKIKIVYNGIDTEKFYPHNNRDMLRAEYNIPKDAFCPAIVARIRNLRNKGHQHLIDILSDRSGARNWHLIILGTGEGRWSLRYQIWNKGLADRIHFLGHKPDVENYLDAADAIVLPSRIETFGLALAEGMAMQKPAAAYDVGGIKEVIEDKKTGFLIPYGDDDLLYERLHYLAVNKEFCQQMGCAAEKAITMYFSKEKMLREILSLYDMCLDNI